MVDTRMLMSAGSPGRRHVGAIRGRPIGAEAASGELLRVETFPPNSHHGLEA